MELPETLIEESSLTRTQVESLSMYLKVVSHEMTLKEAARARPSRSVKLGSFYRTVQQGRKNVKSSIITITIALWMGLVKPEELRRLLDQLGKSLPDLEGTETERVADVIKALVSRIVM